MHFLSSKNVLELETAFRLILDSQRVKEGEQRLEGMRKEEGFELALATFVSRSHDYHQRLLAILQLEKRIVIEDVQTVWSLKEVYFRDSDKIAGKICKLVTAKDNIRMASEFLVVEENETGSYVYRQVEVVFSMFKYEDRASTAVQHHFESLCRYFQATIEALSPDQECFFLVVVCLLLFYSACVRGGKEEHKEGVVQHWTKIEGKVSHNCENIEILTETIKNILFQQPIEYKRNTFFTLLTNAQSKTNSFKISYICKALAVVMEANKLTDIEGMRKQFISAMVKWKQERNRQMLMNLKIYGDIEIQLNNDLQLQDSNEILVRQQYNTFIESIFSHHHEWLKQHLLRHFSSSQAFRILLILVNYYNSIKLPSLPDMIPSLMLGVVNQLEKKIDKQKNFAQSDLGQCITYIEFLNNFRSQIDISSLPSIVSLLVDGASICPNLSPFCDAFLSEIWKQLTSIPYCELMGWMEDQLNKINSNEWAVRLKSYQCFLHLASYIEQAYHHFSTCPENDTLLAALTRSHSIMCEILRENSSIKVDFQLLRVLLGITKSIIENQHFKRSKYMYSQLNVPFLVETIERHLFLDEDTALIVAFHRYHSNQLISLLMEERKEWVIDQLDYVYRIQLYITELQYAQGLIPEPQIDSMRHSLQTTIKAFLPTIDYRPESKSDKLWSKLSRQYNIKLPTTEMMDIQS